jgi:hypothetical protein
MLCRIAHIVLQWEPPSGLDGPYRVIVRRVDARLMIVPIPDRPRTRMVLRFVFGVSFAR